MRPPYQLYENAPWFVAKTHQPSFIQALRAALGFGPGVGRNRTLTVKYTNCDDVLGHTPRVPTLIQGPLDHTEQSPQFISKPARSQAILQAEGGQMFGTGAKYRDHAARVRVTSPVALDHSKFWGRAFEWRRYQVDADAGCWVSAFCAID